MLHFYYFEPRIELAMYEHLPNGDRGQMADFLDSTEPVFLLIFVVEMVSKIIALGFVLHQGSYLRNGWNIMDTVLQKLKNFFSWFWNIKLEVCESGKDFIVVSTGILEMYGEVLFALIGADSSILKKMKLLKMGRVFRPLKMISNSPSLQVVMSAILKALGPIMNIFVLLVFFIVVFSIVGVEFYAGWFHSFCHDATGESNEQLCRFNSTGQAGC